MSNGATGGQGLTGVQSGHHGYYGHYSGSHNNYEPRQPINLALLLNLLRIVSFKLRDNILISNEAKNAKGTKSATKQERQAEAWNKSLEPKTITEHLLQIDLGPILVLAGFVLASALWLSALSCLEETSSISSPPSNSQSRKLYNASFSQPIIKESVPGGVAADRSEQTCLQSKTTSLGNEPSGSVWAATLTSEPYPMHKSSNHVRPLPGCQFPEGIPPCFGKPADAQERSSRQVSLLATKSLKRDRAIHFAEDHSFFISRIRMLVNR